jgi:hypothetical protein
MGILAQAAAAPGPTPSAGAYDLLETEILTGTAASVTFSSLNSTYGADYQHLQIRWTARTTSTADFDDQINLTFNSDTGSNYARHWLRGTGSSVTSNAGSSQSAAWGGWASSALDTANKFGAGVMDILDPFETTKYTTARVLTGGAAFGVGLLSGLWMNTAALTDITFDGNAGNFVAGCRFSLYGLRKAA